MPAGKGRARPAATRRRHCSAGMRGACVTGAGAVAPPPPCSAIPPAATAADAAAASSAGDPCRRGACTACRQPPLPRGKAMQGGTGGHSGVDARACSARRGGQGRNAAGRPAARPEHGWHRIGPGDSGPRRGAAGGKVGGMCQGGLMLGTAVAPVQLLAAHGIRCAGCAGRAVHPATGSEGLQDAPRSGPRTSTSAKSCGILAAPHVLHGAGGAALAARPILPPPKVFWRPASSVLPPRLSSGRGAATSASWHGGRPRPLMPKVWRPDRACDPWHGVPRAPLCTIARVDAARADVLRDAAHDSRRRPDRGGAGGRWREEAVMYRRF